MHGGSALLYRTGRELGPRGMHGRALGVRRRCADRMRWGSVARRRGLRRSSRPRLRRSAHVPRAFPRCCPLWRWSVFKSCAADDCAPTGTSLSPGHSEGVLSFGAASVTTSGQRDVFAGRLGEDFQGDVGRSWGDASDQFHVPARVAVGPDGRAVVGGAIVGGFALAGQSHTAAGVDAYVRRLLEGGRSGVG